MVKSAPARLSATAWVLLLGTFMAVLDFFIVNVAIPDLERDLRATNSEIQFIVAGYAVAYGSALIVGSRIGDRFGRKRIFLLGIALFTAASVLCGVAPTASVLIVGRIVQGLASALFSPEVLSTFNATLAPAAKGRALVAYGFVMGLASVFAQLLGGLLIHIDFLGLGWRSCFLVNLPIGVASFALAARLAPESRAPASRSLDLVGMLVVVSALTAFTVPMIEGRQEGWPRWSFVLLALSAVLFALFISWEARVKRGGVIPLVDLELFGERSYAVGLVAQLIFFMSMAAFYLVLALYLQQGRGLDPLRAGLIFVANGLGYLVTSSQVGRFERMSKRKIVAGAAILRTVGLVALLLAVSPSGDERSVLWLLPGLFLNGAGTGLTLSPLATLILSRVRAEHSGDASGVLNTVLQIGNAIGVAAVGIIFYGAASSTNAFSRSLMYLIVLTLLLAALSQLFPHEHPSRAPNRA